MSALFLIDYFLQLFLLFLIFTTDYFDH